MSNGVEVAGKTFDEVIRRSLGGFSECWELGPQCTVDWSAWGTWAGAAATFFAVLLPYLASRQAARLRIQLAISDFIRELSLINIQLATAQGVLDNPQVFLAREAISMMRVRASIPSLEADMSIRRTLLEVRNLSQQIENWNLAVDVLAGDSVELLRGDGWPMGNAREQLKRVSEAAAATARAIAADLPELRKAVRGLTR
jgi:hypothetical protein